MARGIPGVGPFGFCQKLLLHCCAVLPEGKREKCRCASVSPVVKWRKYKQQEAFLWYLNVWWAWAVTAA